MAVPDKRDIRGVTFDFWNTLVHEVGDALVPARLDALLESLDGVGVTFERDVLMAAHEVAFARYQESWIANQQFVIQDAAVVMAGELGLGGWLVEVLSEGFLVGGRTAALRVCPGATECLEVLRAHGLKTAIICDIGLTPSTILMERLEEFGLASSFDAFVFSDVHGSYKPGPSVFSAALSAMGGLTPSSVAHIGDRRRTDVGGAANAGILPIRYRGVFDDLDAALPDAPLVIDRLDQVPAALRLATDVLPIESRVPS